MFGQERFISIQRGICEATPSAALWCFPSPRLYPPVIVNSVANLSPTIEVLRLPFCIRSRLLTKLERGRWHKDPPIAPIIGVLRLPFCNRSRLLTKLERHGAGGSNQTEIWGHNGTHTSRRWSAGVREEPLPVPPSDSVSELDGSPRSSDTEGADIVTLPGVLFGCGVLGGCGGRF